MSETDKTVAYAIDGNADGFLKAMQQTRAAAAEGTKSMEQAFASLGNSLKQVQSVMAGILAVVAGGNAFKRVIADANEWNGAAGKMAAQLGVTTEKASVLNVAMQRLGIDNQVYLDAAGKLSKQIQSNAQAFDVLGVKVRDASGAYRPVTELMGEVNQKLAEIKNPIEQNIAGQQVYGKGWAEVRAILKLTSEQISDAEKRARELGLIVGPEGVAMSRQYTSQMRDLGLVGKSLEVQFGQKLLPVFVEIGSAMAQMRPLGEGMAVVFQTLSVLGLNTVYVFKAIATEVQTIGLQMRALANGDLSEFTAIHQRAMQEAARARAEVDAQSERILNGRNAGAGRGFVNPANAGGDQGKQYKFGKQADGGASEQLMRMWETQLEERKLNLQEQAQAEGRFAEMSKADEQAYWRDKLALTAAGSADQLAVRKKVATLGLEIQKEEYQTQVASLHTQQEAYKHNLDARAELLQQEATLVRQKYGEHSKEYEAVQSRLTALAREGVAQRLQLEQLAADQRRNLSLAQIDTQRTLAQLDLDLGRVTQQQFLAAQRQFEDQRYQIALQGQQERIQLLLNDPDTNAVAIAQANAQTEALALQHQQRLNEIRAAGVRDQAQASLAISASIESGLVKVGQTMLTSWRSVGTALRGVMAQIGQTIITEVILKPLAAKAVAWVKERALTLASVEANAVEAGSGAAASQASIPYVGPILAIAAMAAMLSQVRGTSSSIPSAAGGWEVPHDTLAMVHEKEMILPAKYSDVIRSMADQPGGPAASGGDSGLAMRVVPMPGDFWMVHRQDLLRATDRAARDKLRR